MHRQVIYKTQIFFAADSVVLTGLYSDEPSVVSPGGVRQSFELVSSYLWVLELKMHNIHTVYVLIFCILLVVFHVTYSPSPFLPNLFWFFQPNPQCCSTLSCATWV